MKRLFRLFLCLALLSGTAACSDDEVSQNLIVINGGEHFLSLDGLARAGKISVLAPAPWRVTKAAGDTWFRLSATEGPAGYSEVELSLDENPGAARSAQLAFACGDAIVPFRLSQGALSAGYDSPDYYFYVTFGTMPTLYAGIHLLSHDKPGYVFYSRSKTFDPAEFPARAEVTTAADRTADATQAEMEAMAREMKRRILEINSADPTAVFGLYVDDLRCRIGYDWFVAQGIDSARVKVSMLSDGTGTYNNFYNYFGDAATAEQNWESYASEVEALDWNHGGRYPETRSLPEFESYTWPYYLSTRPDYRLVVQDGSLLESSCPFITEKLGEMEIGKHPALRDAFGAARVLAQAVLRHGGIRLRQICGAVRRLPEEKPHHHRHEPCRRCQRPLAARLCSTDHGAVRRAVRRVLQTPSCRYHFGGV